MTTPAEIGQADVQRALDAWDTTPLDKTHDGRLQEAMEALRGYKPDSWVDCKERMPEERRRVLCVTKRDGLKILMRSPIGAGINYPTPENWQGEAVGSIIQRFSLDQVTHWRPLPDPPSWQAATTTKAPPRRQRKAPWSDYAGQAIHEGDVIEHPSGERGMVVFLAQEAHPEDQWRVDYGYTGMSRLILQVDLKGMAVVVPDT